MLYKAINKRTNLFTTYKIGFVTLTLPSEQRHTDNEIKKYCLNQLLIELRKLP